MQQNREIKVFAYGFILILKLENLYCWGVHMHARLSSEQMLHGPAGIAGHRYSQCTVKINKDNRPWRPQWRNFSRGRGAMRTCDWKKMKVREKRRQSRQTDTAREKASLVFSGHVQTQTFWKVTAFDLWYSTQKALCLEEQLGYCCPPSLIDGWIMQSDCESSRLCCLPNDKQQTCLATNNNERC